MFSLFLVTAAFAAASYSGSAEVSMAYGLPRSWCETEAGYEHICWESVGPNYCVAPQSEILPHIIHFSDATDEFCGRCLEKARMRGGSSNIMCYYNGKCALYDETPDLQPCMDANYYVMKVSDWAPTMEPTAAPTPSPTLPLVIDAATTEEGWYAYWLKSQKPDGCVCEGTGWYLDWYSDCYNYEWPYRTDGSNDETYKDAAAVNDRTYNGIYVDNAAGVDDTTTYKTTDECEEFMQEKEAAQQRAMQQSYYYYQQQNGEDEGPDMGEMPEGFDMSMMPPGMDMSQMPPGMDMSAMMASMR